MKKPLQLHFKTKGRSYSQLGRKGNVALYAVYGDYFLLKGFRLPHLLIGFELVCIRTYKGRECYPSDEDFGHSAWSIPKSLQRISRIGPGVCGPKLQGDGQSAPKTLPDRSAFAEESAALAAA